MISFVVLLLLSFSPCGCYFRYDTSCGLKDWTEDEEGDACSEDSFNEAAAGDDEVVLPLLGKQIAIII